MKLLKLFLPFCLIFAVSVFIFLNSQALPQPRVNIKTIKIGLLIPDNKSLAAKRGAEMAIRKANERGGFNGQPFQMVVRSMEGPWGTGSKVAVNLIFDEAVWAILGSHDGRDAHLVEQVATKVRIVFLSAWAGDPTLSQAFVPWYFSCVPNDLQKAEILIEEIYNRRKFTKVATIYENSYDSNLAAKSFLKKTISIGGKDILQYSYEIGHLKFNDLLEQIKKADVDCIILFGSPLSSLKIVQEMQSKKMKQAIFGTLTLLDENAISDWKIQNYESVIFASSGYWLNPKGLAFENEYHRLYGIMPGPVAAYAYDGMNLIIQGIINAGLDRDKIQKALMEIKFEGVTGAIQFDTKGNRVNSGGLMQIQNGVPVPVGKE